VPKSRSALSARMKLGVSQRATDLFEQIAGKTTTEGETND